MTGDLSYCVLNSGRGGSFNLTYPTMRNCSAMQALSAARAHEKVPVLARSPPTPGSFASAQSPCPPPLTKGGDMRSASIALSCAKLCSASPHIAHAWASAAQLAKLAGRPCPTVNAVHASDTSLAAIGFENAGQIVPDQYRAWSHHTPSGKRVNMRQARWIVVGARAPRACDLTPNIKPQLVAALTLWCAEASSTLRLTSGTCLGLWCAAAHRMTCRSSLSSTSTRPCLAFASAHSCAWPHVASLEGDVLSTGASTAVPPKLKMS